MQIVSFGPFSGKNKKNVVNLLLAEFVQIHVRGKD